MQIELFVKSKFVPGENQDQILKLYWQPITATGSFDITFLTYPSRFIVMTDRSNVLDVRSRVSLILNCISDSLGSKSIHSQFSFLNWTMILVGSTTRLLFWAYKIGGFSSCNFPLPYNGTMNLHYWNIFLGHPFECKISIFHRLKRCYVHGCQFARLSGL